MKRKMRIWAMVMVCILALSGCASKSQLADGVSKTTTDTTQEKKTSASKNTGERQVNQNNKA